MQHCSISVVYYRTRPDDDVYLETHYFGRTSRFFNDSIVTSKPLL